ncbi:DUF3159 domain-containing protein [Streptomyces sp. NBC_00237]|uniref:DUF3159 domain-containing protein n=1 Tax=Streptomyces sp. NBC_00237 TaxID=2975687 RepID=UPI002251785F|nr:DUF3159 domain-containing protein [Streptomyces sp. NBC_00237]MCX5206641.1 DUF3159 domain-containing protein [Streptomyces sp. NBC_00237]
MAISYCTRPPQNDRTEGRPPPERRGPSRTRRPTLWEETGGPVGLLHSSLPSVAFVLVNSAFGLRPGIFAAIGTVIAFTVLRAARRQPLKPALAGVVGVGISSYFASRSGEARDFFVVDIWLSLTVFVLLVLSLVVRRPLAGVVWSAVNRSSRAWLHDRPSRFGYDVATAVLAFVFGSRFVVQFWLYDRDLAGWLAFAKIAMNYPLWAVALAVWAWAVRRAARRAGRTTP